MGYVATKSRPRYLDTDLKAEFAGDNPDYFDIKTNKWYSTSSGSELVTNGTFTSGTTGWVGTNATLSTSVSRLKIAVTTAWGEGTYALTLEVGKKYRIIGKISAEAEAYLSITNTSFGYITHTTGIFNVEFIAHSSTCIIRAYSGLTTNIYLDDISVFQSDLTIGSEITPRNYLNNIVYADHNGQPEYVEEVAKVEYKDSMKLNKLSVTEGFDLDGMIAYACRAWVNFNGTGTVAIRASGNVSSITDNGTGDYTVNFTTAMPDTNYGVVLSRAWNTTGNALINVYSNEDGTTGSAPTTSAIRILSIIAGSISQDSSRISLAILR